MSGANFLYAYLLAAMLLPTSFGDVAMMEPEVGVASNWPRATSMLQHAAEEKKLKEATEEEEPIHVAVASKGGNCGQTCKSLAPEHAASCAAPAAATQATVQVKEAIQTVAGETKESDSDDTMARVKVEDHQVPCFSDTINWPLLLAGIGLLLAGQFDGWDRLLDGTRLQDKLPEGSLRKLLTVIGLLAFAEGSTLFDARAFALSFACGLTFLALPCLVLYTRRGV